MSLPRITKCGLVLVAVTLAVAMSLADAQQVRALRRPTTPAPATLAGRTLLESYASSEPELTPTYGWYRSPSAVVSPFHKLDLTFAVKHRNTHLLEPMVRGVSDPTSPKYRDYLSLDQLNKIFAPKKSNVDLVVSWIKSQGIADVHIRHTAGSEFIKATIPCAVAERMLQTKFHMFEHAKTSSPIIRALRKYTVPKQVAGALDFIGGIHRFPNVMKLHTAARKAEEQHQKVRVPVASPLPAGNAPVQLAVTGGGSTTAIFFIPRCSDGSAPTGNSTSLCNGGVTAFGFNQVRSTARTTSHTLNPSAVTCGPCASFGKTLEGTCENAITEYGLPSSSSLCLANLYDIEPFTPFQYATFLLYTTGGATSALSPLSHSVINHPWIDVARLNQLYTVTDSTGGVGATQAVAEFLGQYYAPSDLATWFGLMGVTPAKVAGVYGPNNASAPGLEATLDIEYIMGMAQKSPTYFWSFAGNGTNPSNQEPFLEWMAHMANDTNPPWVHSISYDDQENLLSPDYMNRGEQEFQKAALRGLSLLFCAGDDGVGGVALRDPSYKCTRFSPAWPASSPTATAVGGTQLWGDFRQTPPPVFTQYTNQGIEIRSDQQGEVVSSTTKGSMITTGGGFSDTFPTPWYQTAQVKAYLQTPAIPSTIWFNQTGRGYPDISAMATNYLVYLGGENVPIGGTSASTPVTAALITLLNAQLVAAGQKRLGFLNPFIYQVLEKNPNAYTDITVGSNECSVYPTQCCPFGFSATAGWDATSGVGSPIFSELSRMASQLGNSTRNAPTRK